MLKNQQNILILLFKMEKICVKIHSQISQSEAFLCLGIFDETTYKLSYSVTENLQVNFQVIYKCI